MVGTSRVVLHWPNSACVKMGNEILIGLSRSGVETEKNPTGNPIFSVGSSFFLLFLMI